MSKIFYDYIVCGGPLDPDDGVVSPKVVVALLPFAPEITISIIRHVSEMYFDLRQIYGLKPSFNQTLAMKKAKQDGGLRPAISESITGLWFR